MKIKVLLLAGTMIPTLAMAPTFSASAAPTLLAQAQPEDKDKKPAPPAPPAAKPAPPAPPAQTPAAPPAAQPQRPPAPPTVAPPAQPPQQRTAPQPPAAPPTAAPQQQRAAPSPAQPGLPAPQQQRQERGDDRREQRQERRQGPSEQRQEPREPRQEQRQEQRERGEQRPDRRPAPPPPATTPAPGPQGRPATPPAAAPAQTPAAQTPAQPPAQTPAQAPAAPQPPAAAAAPAATPQNVRRLEDFRSQRRETRDGNRTVIQEPGRTIVREGDRTVIRRNEAEMFRRGGGDLRTERRGSENRTLAVRPDGTVIITVTDDNGRLMQRLRRDRNGRETVIIDNRRRGGPAPGIGIGIGNVFVNLAPPRVTIPRERYIVEARRSDRRAVYETFMAPPVMALERPYTLDEIRYTQNLRERMRRVDVDTITFATGSWEVSRSQAPQLEMIAQAIMQVVERNPNEVFLIEGHTDAVGADIDNLSLSDRRAESVAFLLTEQFGVPPENLTTQGYGEEFLKIPTDGPEERNRRVTVRRITPLLAGK